MQLNVIAHYFAKEAVELEYGGVTDSKQFCILKIKEKHEEWSDNTAFIFMPTIHADRLQKAIAAFNQTWNQCEEEQ